MRAIEVRLEMLGKSVDDVGSKLSEYTKRNEAKHDEIVRRIEKAETAVAVLRSQGGA